MASSEVINDNFEYLDGRISSFGSSITTLQSNIASVNSTLSNQINEVGSSVNTATLQAIYPVGSIYIGTMSTCPLAALFGTWTKKGEGRVLQGSDSSHNAGTTIAAGLPNITGNSRCMRGLANNTPTGAFYVGSTNEWTGHDGGITGKAINFNANNSSSVYRNDVTTVQPPAYVVNIWERTA